MGNKFVNKIWNLLGVEGDEYDEEYNDGDLGYIPEEREYTAPLTGKKNKADYAAEGNESNA